MKIIEVFKQFDTNEKCLELLRQYRWSNGITCPYCNSEKISVKNEKDRQNRHQCQSCHRAFTVTVGTIFHSAKKLPEWFQVLALMLNAKKSLSSYQIARDLNLTQPSAWRIQNKIRKAMKTKEGKLLKGIIEMDEIYIGGKPRFNELGTPGTGNKIPVVGMMERGGQVRTEVVPKEKKLTFSTLEDIFKRNVQGIKSVLITDDFSCYKPMKELVLAHPLKPIRIGHVNKGYKPMKDLVLAHPVINHSQGYVRHRTIHTNTIEGFWSMLKRAWFGSHHHYSRENAHLYVGETAYKANNRKNKELFIDTIKRMLG